MVGETQRQNARVHGSVQLLTAKPALGVRVPPSRSSNRARTEHAGWLQPVRGPARPPCGAHAGQRQHPSRFPAVTSQRLPGSGITSSASSHTFAQRSVTQRIPISATTLHLITTSEYIPALSRCFWSLQYPNSLSSTLPRPATFISNWLKLATTALEGSATVPGPAYRRL